MTVKKVEDTKEIPVYTPEPEMPVLVNFNEFLGSLQRDSRIESVGAFIHWMKQQGIPKKLSSARWRDHFDEFVNRKV